MWHRIDDPDNPPPKDGTLVLLYGSGTVAPGIFHLGDWLFWDGDTTDDFSGNPAGAFNGWVAGYGPTYWKPLDPPPPAEDTP